MLSSLPTELVQSVLAQLGFARDLCALACTSRAFAALTDDEARARVGGVRPLWAKGRSWRTIYLGRHYRAGMSVSAQYGSLGTRRSRSSPMFSQPTAITTIFGTVVAVCDAGFRCLTLLNLESGGILFRVPVDGVPTGVACLSGGHGDAIIVLAVVVQGEGEDGAPLEDVTNGRHRIELLTLRSHSGTGGGFSADISSFAAVAVERGRWWSAFALSFPNGAVILPHARTQRRRMLLCCANWNGNSICCVPVEDGAKTTAGWHPPGQAALQENDVIGSPIFADAYARTRRDGWAVDDDGARVWVRGEEDLDRPSDVCALRFSEDDEGVLAVSDFYGGAVHIFARPSLPHAWHDEADYAHAITMGMGSVRPLHMNHCLTLRPQASRRKALDKPSGLAVDATRARGNTERPTLRLLVAETGAMLISVFSLNLVRRPATPDGGSRHVVASCWGPSFVSWSHVCDIAVEQLGTGIHRPLAGQWSWLGLDVTDAGDVVVVDMDRSVVWRI